MEKYERKVKFEGVWAASSWNGWPQFKQKGGFLDGPIACFDGVMCRPLYFRFAAQITSACPIQKVLGYFMEDDFFFLVFCLKLALVAFMCYLSYDRHIYKKKSK